MMASDISTAEAGGYPEQQQENWWLVRWASWLATIGAVVLGFVGIMGMVFNFTTFKNVMASGLQAFAATVILSIEGSSVVAALTFAKPIGMFFEGRPLYVKVGVFAGLTIIPCFFGPSSFSSFLGVLVSAGITCIYGAILVGRKGTLSDMRASVEQPKI